MSEIVRQGAEAYRKQAALVRAGISPPPSSEEFSKALDRVALGDEIMANYLEGKGL